MSSSGRSSTSWNPQSGDLDFTGYTFVRIEEDNFGIEIVSDIIAGIGTDGNFQENEDGDKDKEGNHSNDGLLAGLFASLICLMVVFMFLLVALTLEDNNKEEV